MRLLLLFLLTAAPLTWADMITLNADRDNTIYSEGGISNGAGDFLFTGQIANGGATRRALIHFDLANGLPTGAVINSASLLLEMSRSISAAQVHSFHRLGADWGEGTSHATGEEGAGITATAGDTTQTHRFHATDLWTTPGGDFLATPSFSQLVPGIVGGVTVSDPGVLGDLQFWQQNPGANFGWIILGNEAEAITAFRFNSRNDTDTGPRLVIDFTVVPEPASALLLLFGAGLLLLKRGSRC